MFPLQIPQTVEHARYLCASGMEYSEVPTEVLKFWLAIEEDPEIEQELADELARRDKSEN